MDPGLREILACPCPQHAPLTDGLPDDPDAAYLTCTSCARAFPVRDGIPVLLLEEAIATAPADADRGPGEG